MIFIMDDIFYLKWRGIKFNFENLYTLSDKVYEWSSGVVWVCLGIP